MVFYIQRTHILVQPDSIEGYEKQNKSKHKSTENYDMS